MARDFSKNQSNYMTLGIDKYGGLVAGAGAISVAAWAYADAFNTGSSDNLVLNFQIGNNVTAFQMWVLDSSGYKLRCGGRSQNGDSFQSKTGTSTIATGAWYHFGAVLNIASDTITPYVNGTAEGGGSVTFGAATYTHTNVSNANCKDAIGAYINGTTGAPNTSTGQWDGAICEVAVWTADIGSAGFAALAAGALASSVSAANIQTYLRLLGDTSPEPDSVDSLSGTITGTVAQRAHAPMGTLRRKLAAYRQMRAA